jgi:hypothetical protein
VQGVDATVGTEAADHQVNRWGFNLMMPPTAPAFLHKATASTMDLALIATGPAAVREESVRLPDVFDSNWIAFVEQRINGVEPIPGLLGWSSDCELGWGGWAEADAPLTRPGLLQICLGLDPAYRAYHSAWEFVLARHRGELSVVATDWGVALPGRGAARQMTRDEQIIDSPGYRADLGDFIAEFAQRYFSAVHRAAREINPDCLLLSPVLTSTTPPAVREIAARQCDLLQVDNLGLVTADVPQLWCLSGWAAAEPAADPLTGESAYERRIRTGREQLVTALRDPRVVGYCWGKFRGGDLAVTDPFDAGLVDENGRCNDALVQPLHAINSVAVALRGVA